MSHHEDPLPTTRAATGAATGAYREVDADHIFLLECMEIGCDEPDFFLIGSVLGMSPEDARKQLSRLRSRIYAATTFQREDEGDAMSLDEHDTSEKKSRGRESNESECEIGSNTAMDCDKTDRIEQWIEACLEALCEDKDQEDN